jgi:hypothetical protein
LLLVLKASEPKKAANGQIWASSPATDAYALPIDDAEGSF